MTRLIALPRTLLFTALAGVALVGIGACSSDSNKTAVEDLGTIDVTLPAGVGLPTSEECQAIYGQFIAAMSSAFAPAGSVDYGQVFGEVSAAVPADLQDDIAILSAAFEQFGAIVAANNNDTNSAEVQAAIQQLATPEVTAASTTVQAYFDETCPGLT